jgi:hypothetical protein
MFDRFGQVSFEPVPLARFELAGKWKKLGAIQDEALGLVERYLEAGAEVRTLEARRDAARDTDLKTASTAVRGGKDAPEPQAEPALERKILAATRTREILERAAADAIADALAMRQRNATALASDIQAALDKKAATLAEHARQAASLYGQLEDGRRLAARLAPPPPAPPSMAGTPAADTTHVVTARTTASGPARGDVEGVLRYLCAMSTVGGGAGRAA